YAEASHDARLIADEPLRDRTRPDADARVAGRGAREIRNQARSAALASRVEARYGVPGGCLVTDEAHPGPAAIGKPGDERCALLGDRRRQPGVDVGPARGEEVLHQPRRVVIDARRQLKATAGRSDELRLA